MSKKQRVKALEARVAELERQVERLRTWIEALQAERIPRGEPWPNAGETITGDDPPLFSCDGTDSTVYHLSPDAMITLTSMDGLRRND